jgi:hypothetical protein
LGVEHKRIFVWIFHRLNEYTSSRMQHKRGPSGD